MTNKNIKNIVKCDRVVELEDDNIHVLMTKKIPMFVDELFRGSSKYCYYEQRVYNPRKQGEKCRAILKFYKYKNEVNGVNNNE